MVRFKVYLSILLSLIILASSAPVSVAADNDLSEVRYLLQSYYVDPVSANVLNASSLDEMFQRLGDPYTYYLSAAEYQDFLDSMEDQSFSGIGVMIDTAAEGVVIVSVLEESPAAKAGLQNDDIIMEVDGQALAGLSLEKAVTYIQGAEGSTVNLKIKRGSTILTTSVVRRKILEQTVTGTKLDGQTGYIAIHSFGQKTADDFSYIVKELRSQDVNSWIIDLRDNPGGYLSSALNICGYFIGPNTAVQVKDRDNEQIYQADDQDFVINEPVIFLINQNSASASEILAAAVQDWNKAVFVGVSTYGKGTVQTIFQLSDGGVLKMTVAHFYSPFGNVINKIGVKPDVPVPGSRALAAARLLFSGLSHADNSDKREYVHFTVNAKEYEISLNKVRQPEFWQAWGNLIEGTPVAGSYQIGTLNGWSNINPEMLDKRWPLYYPDYLQPSELNDIPLDKKFAAHFLGKTDWQTVNNDSVELIDSITGERIPLDFQPLDESTVQIRPGLEKDTGSRIKLKPDTVYWLVFHRSIKNISGFSLKDGALVVVRTVGGSLSSPSFKVQGEKSAREMRSSSDYGQALMDLARGNKDIMSKFERLIKEI
jgi:carboxyl-terminal processing protease